MVRTCEGNNRLEMVKGNLGQQLAGEEDDRLLNENITLTGYTFKRELEEEICQSER